MKIRRGFVSNSSSSSYIVKIYNIDMEDFCEKVYAECWLNDFSLKSAKIKLDKWISQIKENNSGLDDWNKRHLAKMEEERESLENVDEGDKEQVVKAILSFHQIEIETISEPSIIILNGFTSMHNDFVQGMGDLLTNIVLYFLFDTDYKLKFKREE